MFDVDGTLAESVGFDSGLFGDIVRSVLGAELGYDFVAIGRAVDHSPRFDDFRDAAAVLECLGLRL
jgi:hypothetical protein